VSSKGYTVLGWITWRIASRMVRRKMARSRSKIAAAAVVAGVVGAGIALARGDDQN
jgi:Zn-dependent protease